MEGQNRGTIKSKDFSTGTGTSTGTTTTVDNAWENSIRMEVNEIGHTIEMLYKERSALTLEERIFKIIFSCVDGKWNKSERIYGEIIQSRSEEYIFD